MIRPLRVLACLLAVTLYAPLLATSLKPQGYVSDFANILAPEARTELQALLRETEQQTSAEIALVTVPSLDGETVEQYANRLFKEWGIGKRGADNGVLVLVAPSERKMRIEVGYGLEGVLPDGLAGQIIRSDFLPQFSSGDYPRGILTGVRHVSDIVRSHHVLTADERRGLQPQQDRPPMLLMVPFFGVFIGMGAFAVGLGLRTKTFFPLVWGALFGGIPLLMALIPFFNASLWILGPFGLAMFAWGFATGHSTGWAKSMRGGQVISQPTGWVMGASSGSGGSSSSAGGGDFGGGSSGGGGASGSW